MINVSDNDLHSLNKKYEFSPRMKKVLDGIAEREVPNRLKEESWTNTKLDGKTPFIDVFEEMADSPYEIKLAHAIVRSWLVTEPDIFPGEAIVGVTRPRREANEHFSWGVVGQVWNDEIKNSDKYRERYDEIYKRFEKLYLSGLGAMQQDDFSTHLTPRQNEIFGKDTELGGLMWVGGYQGHTVPSYPMLLELGIGGAAGKVRRYMKVYEGDAKKQTLYEAMLVILDGLRDFALLYAGAAKDAAKKYPDDAEHFLKVAAVCETVSNDPPKTLGEACQLMWFYCLWDWCDCVGRADQYLFPFYEKCVAEEGRAAAEEYIASLWFKMFENGIHNVTLGGQTKDGRDATNELTYLMLQICRAAHKTHPRVSVRFCKDSPRDLMDLVVKMWSEGMSDPTVASDDNAVSGLMEYGVPLEDARDYTILGCQEIEIPGKSNFGCEDGSINLAKIFEYTINDGCNRKGERVRLPTGYLTDHASVESLWRAYESQVKYFVPIWAELTNYGVDVRRANCAKLVKSIFTESCVERGLNLDDGGSVYNYGVVETAGSAAVADSFTAIEYAVFKEKKISMETLRKAIDANFEGYERERKILLSCPKFGNDIDDADKWCARVLDSFWSEAGRYRSRRGGVFTGACSLLESGIELGKWTWAMPDGRYAGEPLSNTIGPREGNDVSGVTAMLNSVCKLPLKKGVGGTTLNVLLPAGSMTGESERRAVASAVRTFLSNGGQLAQVTTADLDAMKDAQIHPECHRDLIVRIGGFSIEFVQLSREVQNEVISRYGVK
ncbi:MAG: hypothetical protein IKN38_09445 [Clostridia bacterium]|nr:hypothetical protein [Clostridia bacterium]